MKENKYINKAKNVLLLILNIMLIVLYFIGFYKSATINDTTGGFSIVLFGPAVILFSLGIVISLECSLVLLFSKEEKIKGLLIISTFLLLFSLLPIVFFYIIGFASSYYYLYTIICLITILMYLYKIKKELEKERTKNITKI